MAGTISQPVDGARFPDVAAALAGIARASPQARMTGSGACVFAAFAAEREGARRAGECRRRRPAGSSRERSRGIRWRRSREPRNGVPRGIRTFGPRGSRTMLFPLGSRQVVRHRILIPAFVGSIPTSPAIHTTGSVLARGRCLFRFGVLGSAQIRGQSRPWPLNACASSPATRIPKLAEAVCKHLNVSLGRCVVGRFSDGEVMVELHGKRARPRRVHPAVDVRADQRQPDGDHGDGRCAEARVGRAHHRGDPLLRLCAAGPAAALGARARSRPRSSPTC